MAAQEPTPHSSPLKFQNQLPTQAARPSYPAFFDAQSEAVGVRVRLNVTHLSSKLIIPP